MRHLKGAYREIAGSNAAFWAEKKRDFPIGVVLVALLLEIPYWLHICGALWGDFDLSLLSCYMSCHL